MPIKEVLSNTAPVYIVPAPSETWNYQIGILKLHKLLSADNKLTLKGLEALQCRKNTVGAIQKSAQLFQFFFSNIINYLFY